MVGLYCKGKLDWQLQTVAIFRLHFPKGIAMMRRIGSASGAGLAMGSPGGTPSGSFIR